jgi:PIN domain nuclease of toxin-antitoxin system
MKILLDTHTFIWWDSQQVKLSAKALRLCKEPSHTLILSVASVWEMQIKLQLGKLTLNLPLAEIITIQHETNDLEILPVKLEHILALEGLPLYHKDPFDRLLAVQANVEGAILLSCDPVFSQYPVNVVW